MNFSGTKRLYVFILSIIFVCHFVPVLPVIFIVHGSFSAKSKWWGPQGDFFTELEKQAKPLGHTIVPFCWSGTPSDKEIKKAAAGLTKLIQSYSSQEQKILIGHSHGGNVINCATKMLYDAQNAGKPENQGFDITTTTKSIILDEETKPSLENEVNSRQYYIDKVYLLGTPVDMRKYPPNMQVVGSVINMFSHGDMIQKVFGIYSRRYPLQERLVNLEVAVRKGAKKEIQPGHHDLHDGTMGHWLLLIPESLSAGKTGNFDQFKYGSNGKVVFTVEDNPVYVS
jgi:hypothetical protein